LFFFPFQVGDEGDHKKRQEENNCNQSGILGVDAVCMNVERHREIENENKHTKEW